MTPQAEAEAFLAANPRAELTALDKSGLLPHDEQAQAFNRLVIEALARTPRDADLTEHTTTPEGAE